MSKIFDIRLKENFKLFLTGPSRCGKTFFVCDLLQNINFYCKSPPTSILYVYKVWQSKFDEISHLVDTFINDNENILETIDLYVDNNKPILVIFDDLIQSRSLKDISSLFIVDARHKNISSIFLTQRMFVNDEYFRQISQNSDYFCVFKNPRNSSEIRSLAHQITPGDLRLITFYIEATKEPFSYILINLTQECEEEVKFIGNPFMRDYVVKVYTEVT